MKLVYGRCAGLDVHKQSVFVCVRRAKGKQVEAITATFGTFTEDLESLREFLRRHQVQRVVMESTGVYWIPVWNVLERSQSWKFDMVLVNPQQVRALPGEKTDPEDSARLAELGQYSLLRRSFIPPQPIRQLRDLTRRRAHLQQDRNRVMNRIERLLQTVNIKLSSVASDIFGKTGQLILHALAKGESEPGELSRLAKGSLKGKRVELARATDGVADDHFRWLLRELLDEMRRLNEKLAELEARIRRHVEPYQEVIRRLCTIPGVQEVTAWTLIAELGVDMTVFADAAHAASWAGLCPGNCESAGKRQSGRTRKGNRYLRRALVQSGWTVTRKKDCFLTALFYRIAARRGMKKAALAVAHRILIIAYLVMREGVTYREAGGDYFDRLHPERTARRLTRRLERIGFEVSLTPVSHSQAVAPEPGIPDDAAPKRRACKCAKWGIPCIHVRNTLSRRDSLPRS
jgi:transposase